MAELRTPQGHILLLPEGSVSIGADHANDVPVATHLGLAPVHFRLQPWEGGHFLEDAGSGLGTLVNGHSVNWKPLTHGDVITAGELVISYRQHSQPSTSTVPVVVAPGALLPLYALPPPLALPTPFPAAPTPGGWGSSSATTPPSPSPLALVPLFSTPAYAAAPAPTMEPPAWLPVDLLPEAYQTHGTTAAPKAIETTPEIGSPLPSYSKPLPPSRALHRILACTALLSLLLWAGHTAWQRGHLTPLIESLRTLTHQSNPSASPAVPDPSLLSSPSLPKNNEAVNPPPSAQVATQGTR